MKTRFLHALIAAAAIAVAMPSYAAEAIGVVGALQGSASAQGTSGARTLKVGDQVFIDEEVTTSTGSKLQLMLNDRSTITLNPNSKVKVKEFAYDANSDSGSLAMEGVKGAFRFIGGALSKQNPVTIKTPVSSIGIRGGIADTHIAANGATDAIFLFGDAMTMTNQNGQTTQVTTPGQGLSMVTPNDIPTFTPPNIVQQHLGTFDAAPIGGGTGAAPGSDATTPGGEQAGSDTSSASTEAGESTSSEGDRAAYGSFAEGSTGGDAAGDTATGSGTTGGTVLTTTSGDFNNSAANTTTTASTINNSGRGGNTNNTLSTNAEFRGRYGFAANQNGNAIRERGMINVLKNSNNNNYIVNATENAPNSGATHNGVLPLQTRSGYEGIANPFTLDPSDASGSTYTGFLYATPSQNSFYYHMREVGGGDIINFFFGRQIALSQLSAAMTNTAALSGTQGTNGVSYYLFAPDLLAYEGVAGTPLGFFDYGIKDISVSNIVNDNGRVGITPFGMAVDWTNQRFLSGAIYWGSGAGQTRDLIMAFGKINPAATGTSAFFSGLNYEFRQDGSIASTTDVAGGTLASPAGVVYGNANNQIESFIVQGQAPGGYSIETPAMRVDPGAIGVSTVNHDRETKTYTGFSAGHMVKTVNGNYDVNVLTTNNGPNNVQVLTNDGTNTVSGSLAYTEKTTTGTATGTTVVTNWGGGTNENAYLSKDLYAGRQGQVSVSGGGGTVTDNGRSGFVANATEISNISACKSCEYVHWGVWAGETNMQEPGAGAANVHRVAAIPYVAGEMTNNLSGITGLPGTPVSYTGNMIGTEFNATTNALDQVTGNFSSSINLSTREIVSFTGQVGTLPSFSMTGSPIYVDATGPAAFNFNVVGSGSTTGIVNGGLFGDQAQNIGGNYAISNTSGVSGAGVYLGTR